MTPAVSYIWVGQGASDIEKRGAQQLCGILAVSPSELSEGGEDGENSLDIFKGLVHSKIKAIFLVYNTLMSYQTYIILFHETQKNFWI